MTRVEPTRQRRIAPLTEILRARNGALTERPRRLRGDQTMPDTDGGNLIAKTKAYVAAGGEALCP